MDLARYTPANNTNHHVDDHVLDEYTLWGFGFVYDYKIACPGDCVVLCTDVVTGKPAYTYHIQYSVDRSIQDCQDDINCYGEEVLHEVMELARHRGKNAEWMLVSVNTNTTQLQNLVDEEDVR